MTISDTRLVDVSVNPILLSNLFHNREFQKKKKTTQASKVLSNTEHRVYSERGLIIKINKILTDQESVCHLSVRVIPGWST